MQRPHTTSYKPKLLHTNVKLSPTMVDTNTRLKISHNHLATSNSNKINSIANKERKIRPQAISIRIEKEEEVEIATTCSPSAMATSSNRSSRMAVEAILDTTSANNANVDNVTSSSLANAML